MIKKITLSILMIIYALLNIYDMSPWNHLLLLPFFLLLFWPQEKKK